MIALEPEAGIADQKPDIKRRRGSRDLLRRIRFGKVDRAHLHLDPMRCLQVRGERFQTLHPASDEHEIHAERREPLGERLADSR